jgi:hypothetical protein
VQRHVRRVVIQLLVICVAEDFPRRPVLAWGGEVLSTKGGPERVKALGRVHIDGMEVRRKIPRGFK